MEGKNTSDVEMRKAKKHARRFYEKPRFVEVQLMAEQTLTTCGYKAGDNVTCNTYPMSS